MGTGPYKLESWEEGQTICLVKNEDYFKGAPKIDRVIFKIVTDDTVKAMQLKSGELDLALLTPKDAAPLQRMKITDVMIWKPRITEGFSLISTTITGRKTEISSGRLLWN